MKLEEQLNELAKFGLVLDDGITIDDLLYSFDREAYEEEPFELVLFVLGCEVEKQPWGRPISKRVWNFDAECISETGDYVKIVKRLCEVAGQPGLISNPRDFVDLENGEAWLKYEIGTLERHWPIEVNDDWADMLTLSYVMADIEHDGYRFFYKDNGQAMILFYLDDGMSRELNGLANGALQLVTGSEGSGATEPPVLTPETAKVISPWWKFWK